MALSAAANLVTQARGTKTFVVKNSQAMYANGLCGLDTDGYLVPWADTAGHVFLGVFLGFEPAITSGVPTTAGNTSATPKVRGIVDVSGKILRGVDVATVSTIASLNDNVFCSSDDHADLTLAASTNVKAIGRLIDFRTTSDMDVQLYTPWEYLNQGASVDITTLTDSTGQSGTHDDTLAATTVPTITATNPAAPTAYAAVVNMTDPVTKAEGEAVSAALATLRGEVATYETAISALVVDVAAILALLAVMTQNQSDTAQKVIEILAQLNKN